MRSGHRLFLLGAFCVAALCGCKFDANSGDGVSNAAPTPVDPSGGAGNSGATTTAGGGTPGAMVGPAPMPSGNSIVATPSIAGPVTVTVGASQHVSVTFTSSDGQRISGFAISGTTLPEGWSGPEVFTCTSASTGNDCVLNLTYAPTAAGSGSLVINYIYVDHAGVRRTPGGSLTIPYSATASNHVVADVSPSGQVIARAGSGTQTVVVNFTTDDGNAATALALNDDLAALPANWRSATPAFTCAIVSNGNGCQLVLEYSPGQTTAGLLTLHYAYVDNTGTARSSALNVPYSTASSGTVVATVSPAGQINATQNTGAQAVAVTFTTDDGKPAAGLAVASDLKSLPPGWRSESAAFRCGSVSTGNGCQLRLDYEPKTLTNGLYTLSYVYADAAGTFKTGSVNLVYAATTDNGVTGTASPSGQVNAVVGLGAQNVSITFDTDDGRPATALELTTTASDLPSGWSGAAGGFACVEVTTGTGCQLTLTYAPLQADAGTIAVHFAYTNNAGKRKTGTVNVPYRATTDDNIVGTPLPAVVSATTGTVATVTVGFTTDDGNPATALQITSGLDALPPEWSSATPPFACPAIGGGADCHLALSYAPTLPASGSVTLGFSYTNNSGIAKTGTVTVPYSAVLPPPPPPP